MKKRIHIKLDGEERIDKEYCAIVNQNKIQYLEDSISVTITRHKDFIEMKRECSDYKITLNLKKEKSISYYQVFGASKIFELETKTTKYQVSNNKIEIDYDLEGNNFSFQLEVME